MGFELRKRQSWLFLPAAMLEVAVERLLATFNVHPLLQALFLILIAVFLAALILKGKAIFHWRFYSKYYTIEVTEVEVPPDKVDKILGTPKSKERTVTLKGKTVKREIRKKRFEL